jgi:hypothetical protein
MLVKRIKELKRGVEYMTKMTLIEALEKLVLIKKNGLDTLVQIQDSENEPITIIEAIKAIRNDAIDIYEADNYVISGDGIQKIGDDGYLGNVVYRVKDETEPINEMKND